MNLIYIPKDLLSISTKFIKYLQVENIITKII